MKPEITKGQASCLVLGEAITDANRVKCNKIVEQTPFTVVYTEERGPGKPMTIGKTVVDRDPFTYLRYPGTPSPVPEEINPPPVIVFEENEDVFDRSDSSSCKSVESVEIVKATKASVMDFLHAIFTENPSSGVKPNYELKTFTEKDLFNLLVSHIPSVGNSYTPSQVSKWMSSDGFFNTPKSTRQGNKIIKARNLWVLQPKFIEDALEKTFNRKKFQQMTRQLNNYATIGYCRKSPSGETAERRTELLQKMICKLKLNDLCEKVFVSPTCLANSGLLRRDKTPTNNAKKIMKQLRFIDGDMQDLIMFTKTTKLSVRLVVLDYAGLSTDPNDIKKFMRYIKKIEEIVVDHGHRLESFTRTELNSRTVISKFNCRKGAIKRSAI